MNYLKLYTTIIEQAQHEQRNKGAGVYYELHHIRPCCIGGTNDPSNLVLLTAREHFVAHQLLVKIHPTNSKLIFALNIMTVTNSQQVRNNRKYKWLKERAAKAQADRTVTDKTRERMRIGQSNRNFTWTKEQREKMSEQRKGHNRNTPEVCEKISAAHKGKVTSEETKALISVSKKGVPIHTNEYKTALSKRQTGTTQSEETRNKISASLAGKNAKWHYVIEGVRYTSISAIANKYGIHKDTVTQRCRNKNKTEWNRYKL